MSFDKHPFRWVPSLKHMAVVKTIETLWRNLEDKKKLKDACMKEFRSNTVKRDIYGFSYIVGWPNVIPLMVQDLEIAVDTLPLPNKIKDVLVMCLGGMVEAALNWLHRTPLVVMVSRLSGYPVPSRANGSIPQELKNHWAETLHHFVDNMKWNNAGCVDDRSMLVSWVSKQETIDFKIWEALCIYCIEDDIIKFAKTIDWNTCREFGSSSSNHTFYWYHKIYGKFPTKEMFKREYRYRNFEEDRDSGFYNEENVAGNMLEFSVRRFRDNASTISYFLNQLKDKEELRKVVLKSCSGCESSRALAQLLRATEKDAFLETRFINTLTIGPLMKWPWILLIDDWTSFLQTIPSDLTWVFPNVGSRPFSLSHMFDYYRPFYEPFQEVWRIFNEKRVASQILTGTLYWFIFTREDVTLNEKIFEGMESQQYKFTIDVLGGWYKEHIDRDPGCRCERLGICRGFFRQFCEKISQSSDDQKLLQEVVENTNPNGGIRHDLRFGSMKKCFYPGSRQPQQILFGKYCAIPQ